MTIVRRIIATAAVAGTLAVLPVSVITTQSLGGITVAGGQGTWPFGK
ncbi:MAG: hypothetical protein QM779_07505 [Propionicimonas sp.]